MDTSALNTNFMGHLATINPDVHLALTTASILPSTQSPTDIAFAIVESLFLMQNEYNSAATAPPYMNLITRKFDGSPIVIGNQLIRSKERQLNFQEILGPVDVGAPSSNELIVFN